MLQKILLCCIMLAVTAGASIAEDVRIEAEARYWFPDLSAEARYVDSGIGTQFDVKDDLGYSDEDFPEARITWYTGPNSRLRLDYTEVDYSGDKTLTREVQFSGSTYTIGTRVVSDFEMQYLRFGWIWEFINLLDDKVKLGTILDIKAIMADIKLDAPSIPVHESEDVVGGLPTVGLACEFNPIKKLNVFAELAGITAGDYGYFFDAEVGVKYIPFKNFSVNGGYRMFKIKVEDDPDFAEIEISGPFLGASLRF